VSASVNTAEKLKERYTYADYRAWDDGFRWELIDGEAFCMSPGPGRAHQTISMALSVRLGSYFEGKKCRVFAAPFDVLLGDGPEDEIDTVVQPDILVVCDPSKLRAHGVVGAPDVVFEILSSSTAARDLADKLHLYERSGVKEYLIVAPDKRAVTAYRRENARDNVGFSQRAVYGESDTLEFETFPELKIPLKAVFRD
jgi:Uma2 family endonuclease